MGWKNVKEHYEIEQNVHVRDGKICIGSGYISEMMIIAQDSSIIKSPVEGRYKSLYGILDKMREDVAKLRSLIEAPDTFSESITVYTYEGGQIIEKQCEELGWPNVTHDGEMMYENKFSTDKEKVIAWAKRSAQAGIDGYNDLIARAERELAEFRQAQKEQHNKLTQLETDYPSVAIAE